MQDLLEFFGEPISVYSVQDAIADGVLVPVSAEIVRSAGLAGRVVMTSAAHELIAWADSPQRHRVAIFSVLRELVRAMPAWEREEGLMEVGDRRVLPLAVTAMAGLLDAPAGDETPALAVVFELDEQGEPLMTLLLPTED